MGYVRRGVQYSWRPQFRTLYNEFKRLLKSWWHKERRCYAEFFFPWRWIFRGDSLSALPAHHLQSSWMTFLILRSIQAVLPSLPSVSSSLCLGPGLKSCFCTYAPPPDLCPGTCFIYFYFHSAGDQNHSLRFRQALFHWASFQLFLCCKYLILRALYGAG